MNDKKMAEREFNPDKWYTARELAYIIGIQPRLIYYYATRNKIQSDKSKRPHLYKASKGFLIYERERIKRIHNTETSQKLAKTGTADKIIQIEKNQLSWLWRFRIDWQKFIDDPNRIRLIRWIGVLGAIASIASLLFVFYLRPVPNTDPVAKINKAIRELLSQKIPPDLLDTNSTIAYVRNTTENACREARDIDRAISAVQAYISPRNPEILRLVAAAVLAELCREQGRGNIKRPKHGFLRGADLSELTLRQYDFSCVDFVEAKFTNTNLQMCRFDNTDFTRASFLRANLDSTLIGQSIFEGASLKKCSFRKAIIAESNMREVSFEHCSFQDATIFACSFQKSNLLQCNFHNTNIIASDFSNMNTVGGVSFQQEPCDQGTGIDFSTARFDWKPTLKDHEKPQTIFFPSLNQFYFEFSPQSITDFSYSKLKFVNFSRTCLQGLKFICSGLKGAIFEGCDLSEADFRGANIECTSFQNANVQNALNLDKVENMKRADFRGAVATREFLILAKKKGAVTDEFGRNRHFSEVSPRQSLEAVIPSPQTRVKDAEKYQTVIDLRKYYDAPEQPERAVEYYTRILQQNPKEIEAYNNRANAYCELGQYERAIEDFNHAIELDPQSATVYCNRGRAYNLMNQPERALEDLDRALQLDLETAICYNNRGISYGMLGQYQRAIEEFNRALKLNPKFAFAYRNRGFVHYLMGQHNLAIKDFTHAIELDPKDAMAYYKRGSVYEKLGDRERAESDFRKARDLGLSQGLKEQ